MHALTCICSSSIGIFVEAIHHLLVICTSNTVIVLGLGTEQSPNSGRKELNIFATDLNVSSGGVEMTSVVGTSSGRVFMCGVQDGALYELSYQAKEGWFSKKSVLINHSSGGVSRFLPSILPSTPSGTHNPLPSLSSSPN